MRSTADGQASPRSNDNNNNNNNSNENSGNSGSQYALCALGVGLVALGIVMIVWSIVPAETTSNSNSSTAGGGHGDPSGSRKSKASSVAFVLVGSGVVMLLLSLCLGMRNRQREQQRLQEAQNQRRMTTRENRDAEMPVEDAQRYAVPTYEEVVGSGQYPVRQSNLQPSSSQLPSYDDLVQVDGVQYEFEVAGSPPVPTTVPTTGVTAASNRKHGRSGRKLLPIKIRRIKSEKTPSSQPATGISIEPLTPPPQYEDKVPPL
ncbi:transmembrane protein 51a [Nerophis ophidion]|uniref:transmembrane protein 51a n=1 Tax=Nerophis ophidion TaxID=159077 RepID=UPI002ADFDB94|nr:transmembrane protein 51a [Nerophis ophidion]XP_061759776.1 transmembrane protein 51a [Nerophis ophidion]